MKPFDLEAAKRGEPVQTRGGLKAEIAYFDMGDSGPLAGRVLIGDRWYYKVWNEIGKNLISTFLVKGDASFDLFMALKTRTLYRRLRKHTSGIFAYSISESVDHQSLSDFWFDSQFGYLFSGWSWVPNDAGGGIESFEVGI